MTETTADTSSQGPDVEVPRSAWLALGVSTLVTFLVVVDISAVNVAFPSIRADFDVTRSQTSWVVSGYSIVVGSLVMVSGRLADSIGRRKVFLPGVAIFGLGSLLCGLAPNLALLIGARLIQGIGGAITTASGFAVMLPGFPPARRSTAIGFAGGTGALGAVAGPALGSVLIDAFSWRAIFLINVPLCVLVVVLGTRLLSESKDPAATGRIDLVGVPIGTAAVGLIMFAIVQSESWGVGDVRVLALAAVGLALLPALLRRSRVHPEPLIDLDLFAFRSFTASSLGTVLYGLGFTAGFLINSLMLQEVWDLSIRTVGLALMPGPLLAGIVSPLTGRLADRYGHRWLLGIGCMLCALNYLLYATILSENPAVWTVFVPVGMLLGAGVGLTVATWSSAGLSDIPPARFGVATATYGTFRQAAYGFGVAVAVTLLATVSDASSIEGYRRAWLWVAACYVAAGVAVMVLFPAGSSHDRTQRGSARR